jgi:hypothetical protein
MPLKLYVQTKREAENIVHHTMSLCLQPTGLTCAQDHVPCGGGVQNLS